MAIVASNDNNKTVKTKRHTTKKSIVKKVRNKKPSNSWKKGQSGNPNGRPKKGEALSDVVKKLLTSITSQDIQIGSKLYKKGTIKYKELIATRLIYCAVMGEPWAVQLIFERTEGKAVQPIDLPTGTITIDIV